MLNNRKSAQHTIITLECLLRGVVPQVFQKAPYYVYNVRSGMYTVSIIRIARILCRARTICLYHDPVMLIEPHDVDCVDVDCFDVG